MEPKKRRPLNQIIKITLITLGVLLIALFIFLVHDYLILRHNNLLNHRSFSLSAFVQKHGPLNASEVSVIRPWMTFDYINRLFGLPKDYLKDQLHISDSRYPVLTLSSYASANKIDATAAVSDVQQVVVSYFSQSAF